MYFLQILTNFHHEREEATFKRKVELLSRQSLWKDQNNIGKAAAGKA